VTDTAQAAAVEFEPRLVEAAVLAALRGRPAEAEFRTAREALYLLEGAEERETAFGALHAAWFTRLGLGAAVVAALREHPAVSTGTDRCLVQPARSRHDEGAELFVAQPEASPDRRRTLVLSLHPQTFADLDRLRMLLRRELLHVADMLDPAFGYSPQDPTAATLPPALLRSRYGLLWNVFVDGRLTRRGELPPEVRARRLREFAVAFPMLGARTEEAFERLFGAATLTHADLVRFALDPRAAGDAPRTGVEPGERCPLCQCPTYAFEPAPERLSLAVQARIRERSPHWAATDGLCQQCADLYRARAG